ncbi:response regulator transcription factor [Flavobacterium terrae]|uniref:Two component transcriptional regulator, LuxR family n=1 Tax=Flavobacterium terrae TaxID=415425 RepID=A0A1M6FKH4_9FLAO|nr:response regulator transcription factor [Flavobacterium terrae]SHI98119.1 two component transcriptional regulator, LuxR family [Flavobacterium terrae]
MKNKIKIILADDEVLFRKGISFLLEREENFEIIFEVSNGKELVSFLRESTIHPDIIMMDLKMPLLNGVEATRIIMEEFPEVKIIALTSYDSKSFIANMINIGAASYLVKNTTPLVMIKTINEVYQKGVYYNDQVLKIIQEGIVSNTTKHNKSMFDEDYLTNREKEVLMLICKQLNTHEIADKLFISPRTVEGHRNNLLLKTESKNVAGLVVYAIQNKLIGVDDLVL